MVLNNWLYMEKEVKLDPYLTSYTKVPARWIKDLNIKHKNMIVI